MKQTVESELLDIFLVRSRIKNVFSLSNFCLAYTEASIIIINL